MGVFELLAILTTVAAVFGWINHRFIRLPTSIGLMLLSLVFSLALVLLGHAGFGVAEMGERILAHVDFDETLLHGMLGALLFAGALHVDLDDLAEQAGVVLALATAGVLLSTAIVGVTAHGVFAALGLDVSLLHCLVFGALISPTDPIAVLATLKTVSAPRPITTKIAGESLFNDGVGVVVFLVLLGLAGTSAHAPGGGEVSPWAAAGKLLLLEAGGGVLLGLAVGYVAYRMIRSIDAAAVELLVTLAIVTGGYAAARALHVSGPLAMVVAGLLIGNRGRRFGMSDDVRQRLDVFWELGDEFLNAVLFVLIGLEVLVLEITVPHVVAGLVLIPVVLASRLVSVAVPITLMRPFRRFTPHAVKVLTWGGLRGGISVALALSLPAWHDRELLIAATYVVVCFSILVQGLTIKPLLARLYGGPAPLSIVDRDLADAATTAIAADSRRQSDAPD